MQIYNIKKIAPLSSKIKENKKEKKKEKSGADKIKAQTDYQREKKSKQDKGFNLITKT